MKKIVLKDAWQVTIEDAPMPEMTEGHALLRVLYGGICGSDLSSYRGTMKYITYPQTPGHEFSAEIVDVCDNDRGLKKGMHVTANPYFNCGKCYPCSKGLVNCCTTNQTMGIHRVGAFAEYIVLPIERIYDGKGLNPKTLALVEPFCISHHGIKRANIKKGESVLVVGAGAIGLLAAIAALKNGGIVTICDVAQDKLAIAKNFGIQNILHNTGAEAFSARVDELTGGNGFDVVVEAVGLPTTFQNCIDAVCFGGRMVQLGVSKQNVDFFFTSIQQKELTVLGSRNARKEDFIEVIETLRSGNLNIDAVVTHMYKMAEAAKAFSDFDQKAGEVLKAMIDFS